jgi:hypothetical protein
VDVSRVGGLPELDTTHAWMLPYKYLELEFNLRSRIHKCRPRRIRGPRVLPVELEGDDNDEAEREFEVQSAWRS